MLLISMNGSVGDNLGAENILVLYSYYFIYQYMKYTKDTENNRPISPISGLISRARESPHLPESKDRTVPSGSIMQGMASFILDSCKAGFSQSRTSWNICLLGFGSWTLLIYSFFRM